MLVCFLIEQARQTLGLRFLELLFHRTEFIEWAYLEIMMYLCLHNSKTKTDMEVISIERSTYEELLTNFNSFVTQMRAMADRGTDKGLGDWLDNQDVCQMLNISPRTLQTLRDNGTFLLRQAAKPSGRIHKSIARCTISLRMWRVFFMLWLIGVRKAKCVTSKRAAYERSDNAA